MRNIVMRLYARVVAVLPLSAFLPPAEPGKLRCFLFGLLAAWAIAIWSFYRALILFDARAKRRSKWLARLAESGFACTPETVIEEERAVPGWFRALAGAPKSDAYVYSFIPPRKSGAME